MADFNVPTIIDAVGVAEDVSVDFEAHLVDVVETVSVADALVIGNLIIPISVYDDVGAAEDITMAKETTFIAGRTYSGIVLTAIDNDWTWTDNYPGHVQGKALIALVVIPGGTDTFSIKDGSDAGPYIYYKEIAAAETILYNGVLLRPYVDFSECVLNAGHKISFLWGTETR